MELTRRRESNKYGSLFVYIVKGPVCTTSRNELMNCIDFAQLLRLARVDQRSPKMWDSSIIAISTPVIPEPIIFSLVNATLVYIESHMAICERYMDSGLCLEKKKNARVDNWDQYA